MTDNGKNHSNLKLFCKNLDKMLLTC